MNNVEFTKDPAFQEACDKAGVQPTTRQASKYRRGYGAAYNAWNNRAPESRALQKTRPEALNRVSGRIMPQNYGPYAADSVAANTAPKKK